MTTRYKFGDVLEWGSARWMVVRWTGRDRAGGKDPIGYDAIWIGHDKRGPRVVGEMDNITVRYSPDYLVPTDD